MNERMNTPVHLNWLHTGCFIHKDKHEDINIKVKMNIYTKDESYKQYTKCMNVVAFGIHTTFFVCMILEWIKK